MEIGMMGLVKETGVDDPGLIEFHLKYFSFPLYKDVDWSLYKAFGNRRLSLSTWNPLRLYRGYKELTERLSRKKIEGNLSGEGIIQGGVLVIDKQGKIQYAYEEVAGEPLEVDDIKSAIKEVLENNENAEPEL